MWGSRCVGSSRAGKKTARVYTGNPVFSDQFAMADCDYAINLPWQRRPVPTEDVRSEQ